MKAPIHAPPLPVRCLATVRAEHQRRLERIAQTVRKIRGN